MAHRILIVDDNPDIRWILSDLLESHGYRCEKAPNGVTALTMVQEQQFDAILLDYQMPKMNGIELLQHLSTSPDYSRIPVIMITALTSETLATEAYQAGALAVLTKPVNLDEVLSTVSQIITRPQTMPSIE